MNYQELTREIYNILKTKKEKGIQEVINLLQKKINKYDWVGVYMIEGDNLILGPWAGGQETEHTKIPIGHGICGAAAATGKTEIIGDVHSDSRYLSCFVTTKSEIVVPIKHNGTIIGEIDIDSNKKNAFSIEDKKFLEKIADMLAEHI